MEAATYEILDENNMHKKYSEITGLKKRRQGAMFRPMWASSVQCRHWSRCMEKQALYHMPYEILDENNMHKKYSEFTGLKKRRQGAMFRPMWASSVQCRHWSRCMEKQALYHMPWMTTTCRQWSRNMEKQALYHMTGWLTRADIGTERWKSKKSINLQFSWLV